MDGKDRYQHSFQNKTPLLCRQRRNEESCETNSRVVSVTVIVEPVVVPVPGTVIVPVEIQGVAVTVRVAEDHVRHHLFHHPLKFFRRSQD